MMPRDLKAVEDVGRFRLLTAKQLLQLNWPKQSQRRYGESRLRELFHAGWLDRQPFGYGLGHWGMGRAAQLAVALAVSAVLVVFSQVWLSFYRYGPLEWVWRAVTYLKVPAMRTDAAPAGALPQPN